MRMGERIISIRLPESLLRMLDERAREEGLKRSHLIRRILKQYFSEKPLSFSDTKDKIINKKLTILFNRLDRLEREVSSLKKR